MLTHGIRQPYCKDTVLKPFGDGKFETQTQRET